MPYKVTCYHHKKAIIKGDLEAETIIESCEIFNTKKEVVSYLKTKQESANKIRGTIAELSNKRGEMPKLSIYTNNIWVHENTGEEERESYWYKTEKV